MPKRTRDYRDSLLADLQDTNEAAAYITAAMEDSQEMFLIALRDVAAASQLSKVAEQAGVSREAAYRMLSRTGNPTLNSLLGVLKSVGIVMCFKPAQPITTSTSTDEDATGNTAIPGRIGTQNVTKTRSLQ